MVESLLQPVEVEIVFDELLIDLTEEVVILQTTEPLNPPTFGVLRIFIYSGTVMKIFNEFENRSFGERFVGSVILG